MGIWKRIGGLFGQHFPTAEWQEDRSHLLEVDFGVPSLGGVAPDQPIADLSWLGPADEAGDSSILFYSKGLQLFPIDGELNSWGVPATTRLSFAVRKLRQRTTYDKADPRSPIRQLCRRVPAG